MNLPRKTTWHTVLMIALSLATSAGCGINRRYANDSIRQLPHSHIAIEYTTPGTEVRLAGGVVAPDGTPIPAPSAGRQTLSIVYPHPNPKQGRNYAEVTLRNGSPDGHSSPEPEAHRLVPNPIAKWKGRADRGNSQDGAVIRSVVKREELEFLLRDLVADGFFDREQRQGGTEMQVTLGSRSTKKNWDQVASLDQLAQRVQTERQKPPKVASRPAPKAPPLPTELLPPIPTDDDAVQQASHEELMPDQDPVKF